MRELTENHKKLTYFFKYNGFDEKEMLAVCLLCRTDEQAREMLQYCYKCKDLNFTSLLEKAVEIYQKQ